MPGRWRGRGRAGGCARCPDGLGRCRGRWACTADVLYRTMRAPLPNGAHLNRAHPFSEQIVLRAPDGEIVVRDVAHVLFNDQYVAGAFYETPYSTERFVYKVGDDRAFRDLAGDEDPFEAMLDASGIEAEWPWGTGGSELARLQSAVGALWPPQPLSGVASLLRPEEPVAGVAEAGDDVALVVEALVEGGGEMGRRGGRPSSGRRPRGRRGGRGSGCRWRPRPSGGSRRRRRSCRWRAWGRARW